MAEPLDVARWLAGLGLGDYAAAFAAHDIDAAWLAQLTAEDLREIGVASVGHRRRILAAAADLAARPPEPEGERRVVTVLFCDLVESTRLATRLDPEDFREVLARYRHVLETATAPYDGEMVQFVGDGALFFFGHHRLREHDAENAVAAGLEIVRRVRAMDPYSGAAPQVRVGVATGLTVVGGQDASRPRIGDHAVGEASNLAARLQALAPPDTVVVAQSTRERIGALFDCEDLGVIALKGFEQGARAWRVTGHNETANRFEALRTGGQAPALVGRAEETARLAAQFARARQGRRAISLLVGESGLGKSRLARHALDGQGAVGQPVLQCAPYHVESPFRPIRYYLGKRLALREAGGAEAQRAALAGLLADLGLDQPLDLALLAELMETPPPEGAPLAALGAHELRGRMLEVLARLMAAIARASSALVIEDAHWLDPSTGELMGRVLAEIAAAPVDVPVPVHVIVTMRPGPVPDWLPAGETEIIALGRMGEETLVPLVRAVASAAAPGLALTDPVARAIAARCDGSPVFAEEMTRVYLEGLSDGRGLETVLAGLPATLTDSLVARLDRLTVGRRLALVAAVIGTEFPVAILREAAGLSEAETRAGVDELLAAGVLQAGHSAFGEAVSFRHMLLRDAAYRLLLRRDRIGLHAKVAETLRTRFPHIAEALPQVMAHNLHEAGDMLGAVAEWERAAGLAAARSAYAEAVAIWRRAAEACARVQPPGAAADRELACRLALMSALIAERGFNGAGVAEEQVRIERLGRETGVAERLIPMLHARWVAIVSAGDFAAGLDLARQVARMTRPGSGPGTVSETDRLIGHRVLGTSLLFSGHHAEALRELRRFFEAYDPDRHEAELRQVGTSSHALMSMVGMAEIHILFEDFAAADRWRDRARRQAEAGGRAHDICNVTLFVDCVLPALEDRYDLAAQGAARLRAHALAFELEVWQAHADLFEGVARIRLGRPEAGLAQARRGAAALRDRIGFLSFCFLYLADACLAIGETAEAAAALAVAGRTGGETWVGPELARLQAKLLLAQGGPPSEALARLDAALRLAEAQGARLLARRIRDDVAAIPATPPPPVMGQVAGHATGMGPPA